MHTALLNAIPGASPTEFKLYMDLPVLRHRAISARARVHAPIMTGFTPRYQRLLDFKRSPRAETKATGWICKKTESMPGAAWYAGTPTMKAESCQQATYSHHHKHPPRPLLGWIALRCIEILGPWFVIQYRRLSDTLLSIAILLIANARSGTWGIHYRVTISERGKLCRADRASISAI